MPKKFDPTKPVQLRNGGKARIICADRLCNSKLTIIALVAFTPGFETVMSYKEDGAYPTTRYPTEWDLVNIPEVTEKYFPIMPDGYIQNLGYGESNRPSVITGGWGWLVKTYEDGVFKSARIEECKSE